MRKSESLIFGYGSKVVGFRVLG